MAKSTMTIISKLAVLLFLTTHINLGSSVSTPENIFILAGQSNMAGRGGVSVGKWDCNVPPECQPNPSILRLSAQLVWEQAREPLHVDIDTGPGKTCGIGPGMAFANEVLRAKGSAFGVVGLVPCAVGGTKIAQWAKGTPLYNQLVSRAIASVKGGGAIRAVLWYQGESDTVNKADADGYKASFEKLVTDIRSALNSPNLLFIQVALASGEGKFIDTVRNAQLGTSLPNVKCVDAKGLPLKPDNLHLTTMSEIHIGITGTEVKVDTVDYRSPAGEDKAPVKENVEILHETNDGGEKSDKTGAAGFMAKAATAVTGTFQSAKDAVSGKPKPVVVDKPKDDVPETIITKAVTVTTDTLQSAKEVVSGKPKEEVSITTKAGNAATDTSVSGKPNEGDKTTK